LWLQVFWGADEDEWMYRGAVYLHADAEGREGERGPIVHAKCRSDKDAQAGGSAQEPSALEPIENGGEAAAEVGGIMQQELASLVAVLADVQGGEGGANTAGQKEAGTAGEAEELLQRIAEAAGIGIGEEGEGHLEDGEEGTRVRQPKVEVNGVS
jgi:hypothetical protein